MKNLLKKTDIADRESVTKIKDWTTPQSLKNGWRPALHHPVCKVVAGWDKKMEKAKKAGYEFAKALQDNWGPGINTVTNRLPGF